MQQSFKVELMTVPLEDDLGQSYFPAVFFYSNNVLSLTG